MYGKSVKVGQHLVYDKLSDWQIIENIDGKLVPQKRVFPYELINPLFSDYAIKFRTLWIPEGSKIIYQPEGVLLFPIGSILSKTFSYRYGSISFPYQQLVNQELQASTLIHIETRLLIKKKTGWIGLPYVWNEDQKDATLSTIGKSIPINLQRSDQQVESFTYRVPNMNQCRTCHVKHINYKKVIKPIGPKAPNLNRNLKGHENWNQLIALKDLGLLSQLPPINDVLKMDAWDDLNKSLMQRSRSYLDANCAHCHHSQGAASTSGLFLNIETHDPVRIGICKTPIATGNGGANMKYDIDPGHPEKSILQYRIQSTDPAVMMPELGRSLIHQEATLLIKDWISSMDEDCDTISE
jgi:uncharacterized repeat protein (TIGR03806 family)